MSDILRRNRKEASEKAVQDVTNKAQEFSLKGNPELSPVSIGMKWFYYSETNESYFLHYDEVVAINELGAFINIHMELHGEETIVNERPIFVPWDSYFECYPLQKEIPYPCDNEYEAYNMMIKNIQEKCND